MRFLSIVFARFFARFFDRNFTFFNHLKNKREVVAWSFYDFANQPFTTIIITFLYAPYFADVICSSENINGIGLWSLGISITAIFVAFMVFKKALSVTQIIGLCMCMSGGIAYGVQTKWDKAAETHNPRSIKLKQHNYENVPTEDSEAQ